MLDFLIIFARMEPEVNIEGWAAKLAAADRRMLSRAITLVESSRESDRRQAGKLMEAIQTYRKGSRRIGITGTPGVGKSTFINSFTSALLKTAGGRIAILTIDPSSGQSGGSILGDKIRMKDIMNLPDVFIRSSPSKGVLGGIGHYTRETVELCEAAGFQTILIETVGTGQSELDIRFLADEVWWLTMPGSGDEIQGIKKGILEVVRRFIVTKADIDPDGARTARIQLQRAVKITEAGKRNPDFYELSALEPDSLKPLLSDFGTIPYRTERPESEWYWYELQWEYELSRFFERDPAAAALKEQLWEKLRRKEYQPREAMEQWEKFLKKKWGNE